MQCVKHEFETALVLLVYPIHISQALADSVRARYTEVAHASERCHLVIAVRPLQPRCNHWSNEDIFSKKRSNCRAFDVFLSVTVIVHAGYLYSISHMKQRVEFTVTQASWLGTNTNGNGSPALREREWALPPLRICQLSF